MKLKATSILPQRKLWQRIEIEEMEIIGIGDNESGGSIGSIEVTGVKRNCPL